MPLYIYKCNQCLHRFEARQRFSDDPLTECPQCEGQIRRVINSVGVVFKGSGFYVTDSRNGKSATVPNGTTAQNNNTADKSEKKTEDSSSTTPASAEKKETKSSSTTAAAAA